MGDNHGDYLRSSSSSDHENDRSEVNDETTGIGRFYECVFCKRGFTTAQALGGHMNIHRKDRIKSSKPTSQLPSNCSSLRSDQEIQPDLSNQHDHHHQLHIHGYHQDYSFNPASTWGARPQLIRNDNKNSLPVQNSQVLNSMREDWPRSLSLQVGPSSYAVHNDSEEKRSADQDDSDEEEEEELDLELRLGHDP